MTIQQILFQSLSPADYERTINYLRSCQSRVKRYESRIKYMQQDINKLSNENRELKRRLDDKVNK